MTENTDIWREIAELRGRLEAVAMPFCQSKADVEDLVSRAIERAVGNAAKYNAEKGNLFSWVRTILVNLALDDARVREIRKTYSCDMDELANDEAMATSATDERILASSDEEVLRVAINRLFRRGADLSQRLDILSVGMHDSHSLASNLWGAFDRVKRDLPRLRLHFRCKGL